MNLVAQTSTCDVPGEVAQTLVCEVPTHESQTKVYATRIFHGLKRRLVRERRRRKVGRAYDMALEIARVIPKGSEVLDVGCGNGFIAHHLSAILGTNVSGIDVMDKTEAPVTYRRYDLKQFPAPDNSFDAVLLCYVLHHAQDAALVLKEVRRVLREGGLAIIYEDIPQSWWDKGVCLVHNFLWRRRTGSCTFRTDSEWCSQFSHSGFELVKNRALSRTRNITHLVARRTFVIRRAD
jgi:ubiquinone/menaquinone biosynthesis C-methylase UbiE